MPTLAFAPGVMRPGAVGAQEPRLLPFQVAHHHRRIAYGDALRDADDERYAGVSGFEDGVGGERRWHEDERDVRAGLGDGLLHAVEDRNLVHEALAALAGGNARDEVGAVGHAALGVEAALAPGDALHQQARVLVHQNAHCYSVASFIFASLSPIIALIACTARAASASCCSACRTWVSI